MPKNVVEPERPQWQCNMAHTRCMLDKKGYMHVRSCTSPRTHPHTRETHTHKYVILIAFLGNNDSRTPVNVTLYVHCLSCLFTFLKMCALDWMNVEDATTSYFTYTPNCVSKRMQELQPPGNTSAETHTVSTGHTTHVHRQSETVLCVLHCILFFVLFASWWLHVNPKHVALNCPT